MDRFVITGTQRTGSTAIARLLAHHPQVACGDEWNRKVSWLKRVSACRGGMDQELASLWPRHREQIETALTDRCRWIGYRNLFAANHVWAASPRFAASLTKDRFRKALRWWRREGVTIIHVGRVDNLAWLRSKFKARQDGAYWANKKYSDAQVTIPVRQAIKMVQMKEWLDKELRALRRTNPYTFVALEELHNIERCASDLQTFLDIDRMPAPPMHTPQSMHNTVEQHIRNYAEVHRGLEAMDLLGDRFGSWHILSKQHASTAVPIESSPVSTLQTHPAA